jgi:hypothetical protein
MMPLIIDDVAEVFTVTTALSHMAVPSYPSTRVILSLDIRASDASDLLMVGYQLELLCEGPPAGAIMTIRRPSLAESLQVLPPISG